MVSQRKQQIGRPREACCQPVPGLCHQPGQIVSHGLGLRSFCHAKVKREHIAGLKFFMELSLPIRENGTVGIYDFLPQLLIFPGILRIAQQCGHLRSNAAGIGKVGRGNPGAFCFPLLCLPLRGAPVAELEGQAPNVSPFPEREQPGPKAHLLEEVFIVR